MHPLVAGSIALLAGAAAAAAQGAPPAAPPAPLVVLVTVDQMRADYLDRFARDLTGGLARLVRGGARFTDAHHDHGITETAPGHATLLSGRFPRSTGIWSNGAGVDDPRATIVGGRGVPGASPARFAGTTLVDWLRARDPRTRALAVSAKDRSAILAVGRARESVYWYLPDGRFTTSRYYADTLPAWVTAFNARRRAQALAGQAWGLLLPERAYAEPDTVFDEAAGEEVAFPHAIPADSAAAASYVRVTPWMDRLILDFALDGLRALALGRGPHTDVLSVSLSGTDFIGHRYGPDSREMHDQIVRLDRALGAFMDSLYRVRDSAGVVIVLTSDHGVAPIPELAAAGALPRPTRVDFGPALGRAEAALRAARVAPSALIVDPPVVAVDRRALGGRRRALADSVLGLVAADARQVPGVLRVDRWPDLLRADPRRDPIARRWQHQFPARAAIDLVVTLAPGSVWGTRGPVATHGQPHDYDTHVPLVFFGPGFRPGRYAGFVRTVDLAPTLAAVLGVAPTERVDGAVLRQAIR